VFESTLEGGTGGVWGKTNCGVQDRGSLGKTKHGGCDGQSLSENNVHDKSETNFIHNISYLLKC